MEGMKNINKKLRISIFTALFLIGFIYSVYSQATSEQNNAVSSLESNLIIQELINSSINGYSTAGQYLANFLSINNVPTSIWSIIIFFMIASLFAAIYVYLFEIFIQRAKITESETMRKSKILFILTLSLFSAIAIGFAIPFLLNLYGFILLVLVLIALFFFGRAIISYGRSFHHSIKSFAANVEKDLVEVERELKKVKKDLSEEDAKYIMEGIEKINNDLANIQAKIDNAEAKFRNILSKLRDTYKTFINELISKYSGYLNMHRSRLQPNQINELENLIRNLEHKRDSINTDIPYIPSLSQLRDNILREIWGLGLDNNDKDALQQILNNIYNNIYPQYQQILSEMNDVIKEYNNAKILLMKFHQYEDAFKRDIGLRLRKILYASGDRKTEIAILSALDKSKNYIREMENLINERIRFLEKFIH
jgi:Sec-independent protein translocase protein TatA